LQSENYLGVIGKQGSGNPCRCAGKWWMDSIITS
jgi:hypothetical protein